MGTVAPLSLIQRALQDAATGTAAAASRKFVPSTLALIEEFSEGIADWAVCDTLGMQSVKGIAAKQQTLILQMSRRLIGADSMWQRRLGVVLLTHYAKDAELRDEVIAIVRPLRADREHYIQKALAWLDRDLAQ